MATNPGQYAIIADRLKNEVQSALVEYESASKRFAEIVAGVPSHVPTPDSIHTLQQAGETTRAALHRYVAALETHHNFHLHEIVPGKYSSD